MKTTNNNNISNTETQRDNEDEAHSVKETKSMNVKCKNENKKQGGHEHYPIYIRWVAR